jgi:hypothetical protein
MKLLFVYRVERGATVVMLVLALLVLEHARHKKGILHYSYLTWHLSVLLL